jgi:polyferredoxin
LKQFYVFISIHVNASPYAFLLPPKHSRSGSGSGTFLAQWDTPMRKLRIISQTVFFVLFAATFLFVAAFPAGYSLPAHWLLRANPLVALLTSVAARTVVLPMAILAGAVALLTVVFGRFFCGFVCPLGSLVDFSDRNLLKRARSDARRPPRYLQRDCRKTPISPSRITLFSLDL